MSQPTAPDDRDVDDLRRRVVERLPLPIVNYWRPFAAGLALVIGVSVLLFDGSGSSDADDGGTGETTAGTAPSRTTTTAARQVVVQVAGAVAEPGVFDLTDGSRVADAVEAAGGLTDDADLERINLASKINDGERLYVLRRGQSSAPQVNTGTASAGGAEGEPSAGSPVDLNTATAEMLDRLPGVGPSTAKAIIDHRQASGGYRSVEDLQQVKGIGPSKYEQLEPLVRV